MADRHYSRQTPGAAQFHPPGQSVVLYVPAPFDALSGQLECTAAWVWWRPHPDKAHRFDGYDGWWCCTLFRNESDYLSSDLINWAIPFVDDEWGIPPHGYDTYVWPDKLQSTNPGYCYQIAGWQKNGWSKDGKKRRLFLEAGAERLL